jgi:hypothetical protein
MARKTQAQNSVRPRRKELSKEEILQRMKDFPKRKGAIIAALRKSKNRSISA